MTEGKDRRPKGRFVITPESLQAGEFIADLVGKDFNPEETRDLANNYHERMFEAVTQVLDMSAVSIEFISGSYRKTTTFAAAGEKSLQIILDETFDFWIFGLSIYTCLPVFYQLSEEDWNQLITDLDDMFLLQSNAELHETVRQGLWPYFTKHKKSIEFTHTLSRAMMAFILFHEVAHCQLDHLDQKVESHMEHDADLQAAEHFFKLVAANKDLDNPVFYIPSDQYAAPLIALEILDLHEYWLSLNGIEKSEDQIHPVAVDRKSHIEQFVLDNLNEDSKSVYEEFIKRMGDIRVNMVKFYKKDQDY